MTVCEKYLNQFKEDTPAWLLAYKPGCPLDVEEILDSQLLYWTEHFWADSGRPIRLLNRAHAVHVFIYAECYYLHDWCERRYDLKGYDIIDRREIDMDEIAPIVESFYFPVVENHSSGKCELFVYERQTGYSDDHGAERIALLDIGGDTIDLFQRIFCSKPMRRAPFFMGVGDWGGQTPYGREYRDCHVAKGGVPERCLNRHEYVCVMEFMGLVANKFPKFFYALHPGTTPWEGYELLPSKVQPHHNPGHNELEPGRLYECRMGAEIRSTATTVCDDEENDDGSKKISLLKLAQSRHFYNAEDDIRNLEICHTLVREKVPVEEIAAKYGISVYEVCHVRHCINDVLWHFRRHARW